MHKVPKQLIWENAKLTWLQAYNPILPQGKVNENKDE